MMPRPPLIVAGLHLQRRPKPHSAEAIGSQAMNGSSLRLCGEGNSRLVWGVDSEVESY